MKSITINGSKRESVGKSSSKALRNAGQIPCVLYGGDGPIHFSAPELAFSKLVYTANAYTVVIAFGEKESYNAILQDIQFHPVSENPLHVDFLRIGKGSNINVSVPVSFINEELSPGLKTGGVLNTVRFELELMCPADSIPEKIEINLEGLVVGDSIKISSVNLPDGVSSTITDRDFTIATIAAPTVMSEVSTEETVEIEETEESSETDSESKDSSSEK